MSRDDLCGQCSVVIGARLLYSRLREFLDRRWLTTVALCIGWLVLLVAAITVGRMGEGATPVALDLRSSNDAWEVEFVRRTSGWYFEVFGKPRRQATWGFGAFPLGRALGPPFDFSFLSDDGNRVVLVERDRYVGSPPFVRFLDPRGLNATFTPERSVQPRPHYPWESDVPFSDGKHVWFERLQVVDRSLRINTTGWHDYEFQIDQPDQPPVLHWAGSRVLGRWVAYFAIALFPVAELIRQARRGVYRLAARIRRRRALRMMCCEGCGYSLRGLTEPRCPECGRAFNPDEVRMERAPGHTG